MSRTVSASSSVSHMDLQIKHHWNDAVDPSTLVSRASSPCARVSDESLRRLISELETAPSTLSEQQKKAHADRLARMNLDALTQECKADLYAALSKPSRDSRRKAMVEFIRNNDGVIRWAASLRSLAESTQQT